MEKYQIKASQIFAFSMQWVFIVLLITAVVNFTLISSIEIYLILKHELIQKCEFCKEPLAPWQGLILHYNPV